jgi:hypothetical protein
MRLRIEMMKATNHESETGGKSHREMVLGVAVIVALLILGRAGYEVYRWYAYAGERTRIEQMTRELDEVGLKVVTTHVAIDSISALIDATDDRLDARRGDLEARARRALNGRTEPGVYESFRADADALEIAIDDRNSLVEELNEIAAQHRTAVARFNELADSILTLAAGMGYPDYPLRTAAEIAIEHGITPPASR